MTKKQTKSANSTPVAVLNTDEHFLSLDLGNAYGNLQTDDQVKLDWRSIMAPLTEANRVASYPPQDVMLYDGQWWASGERCYALAQDTIEEKMHLARYISLWYRRLFAFGLHRAFYKLVGQEIVYPRIISSVPAKLFKNKRETELIRGNLVGEYRLGNVLGGTLVVVVQSEKLTLIPEGIGTYFGYVFGPGSTGQYETGAWMVADFGYLTLDAVMVRDGEYIPDAAQSDSQTGMSIVADKVLEHIFTESHVSLERAYVDAKLNQDCLLVNGKPRVISDVRDAALEQLAQRATGLLEQWGMRQNLSGVILTGGGAQYLAPYISSSLLPPMLMTKDARRANVDGAFAYITEK